MQISIKDVTPKTSVPFCTLKNKDVFKLVDRSNVLFVKTSSEAARQLVNPYLLWRSNQLIEEIKIQGDNPPSGNGLDFPVIPAKSVELLVSF